MWMPLDREKSDEETVIFQSTLPVGGSDRPSGGSTAWTSDFNPRSPWGERHYFLITENLDYHFNPRSPWGERRFDGYIIYRNGEFQSTLPVGGATSSDEKARNELRDFNPRSPWGERRGCTAQAAGLCSISIHAPRGGSDFGNVALRICPREISIHAPRGGSDRSFFRQAHNLQHISIHAPRGGSDIRPASWLV